MINDLYVCVHTHQLICYSQNIVSITTQGPLTRQTVNWNPKGGQGNSGPSWKGLAFAQRLQDDGVGSMGEDATATLWEQAAVAGADGAAALALGRPLVVVSSNSFCPAWVASTEARASLVKTFKLSSLWCRVSQRGC